MKHRHTKKQSERQEMNEAIASPAPSQSLSDYLLYLRKNGPGLILAGIAFFITPYFVVGVGLFIIGAGLLAWDVWKEVVIPKQTKVSKRIFGIVCSSILAVFAIWLFLPVPLQLSVKSLIPQYGLGSNLYGIPWTDNLSRMDFTLSNNSDVDYADFDVEISTDLAFEGLKQTDGIVNCAIAPASKVLRPTVQRMVGVLPTGPHSSIGGVPSGPVETDIKKDPQQYTIVGRNVENGELIFSGDTAMRYRIRCDKLPAHSEDTFVAAISVINPFVNGKFPEPLHSPNAKRPDWCSVKAKFTWLGRPRSVTINQCKMGQTCEP
jgi:hypothetical protein